jgi:hypothetical protein
MTSRLWPGFLYAADYPGIGYKPSAYTLSCYDVHFCTCGKGRFCATINAGRESEPTARVETPPERKETQLKTGTSASRKGRSAGLRTLVSSILIRKRGKTSMEAEPEVRPADPGGYAEMAYPPPGGTMVRPIGLGCYERVHVRQCSVTEESDMWAHTDDWLPGEYECVLPLVRPDGTTLCTRDVVEWVVELKAACPAAYASLRMAMAAEAMDQTGVEILN